MALTDRITSEPDKFGGRPCIRGLRIRVVDVLDLLAVGLSHAEILAELLTLSRTTSGRRLNSRPAGWITR